MRHLQEVDQLMDALKSASMVLAELWMSLLSPKAYYELCMQSATSFLYDAHGMRKHHLADLYKLVKYAGIVPHLYLMITVGLVYMSIPDTPINQGYRAKRPISLRL